MARSAAMEMHEEYLPQMDEQNKMLKEKLLSRLQFEPGRTESPSVEKKYSILRTAVYRASTARKHKSTIKEDDVCLGNVISRIPKEEREVSVCQPTSKSEHETINFKRSKTNASLMSVNENLKKSLPTTSACKGAQHGFGTPPSSSVHDVIRKTEMQTAVEPICHKKICEQPKVERSSKKSLRTKVYSYDKTEPTDDDVIVHILRLRGKLGWQTKLPPCERLAEEDDVGRLQKFTLKKPLLLKDNGEYIYCLQRNKDNLKAPYNPYDLQAVSANTAMQNKGYWTVTASFVSKFSVGEMETTPVPQWLHERQLLNKLVKLNFFSNFRVMKYFLAWKDSIRRSKMNKTKSI